MDLHINVHGYWCSFFVLSIYR